MKTLERRQWCREEMRKVQNIPEKTNLTGMDISRTFWKKF